MCTIILGRNSKTYSKKLYHFDVYLQPATNRSSVVPRCHLFCFVFFEHQKQFLCVNKSIYFHPFPCRSILVKTIAGQDKQSFSSKSLLGRNWTISYKVHHDFLGFLLLVFVLSSDRGPSIATCSTPSLVTPSLVTGSFGVIV